MSDEYADPRIETTTERLRIRHYYLPYGDKRIGWDEIRSVGVEVAALRGRFRIWGAANPHYWANLDPSRPRKKQGFILDLGSTVKPFVTPTIRPPSKPRSAPTPTLRSRTTSAH
jgi:hypothetical protein